MSSEFWNWLLGVVSSSGIVALGAYLMRDTVVKYVTKIVDHQFAKKIETFKAELRDNEKELEQIRSFLASARRERDSAIQAKRLEAAELLMRARHVLSQLTMLVEYMKILKMEQIFKNGDDPKIAQFMELLVKPLDIDEKMKALGTIDKTLPRLYLSDKSMKFFEAYEGIMIQAAMMMKLFTIPLRDKGNLVKTGSLSEKVIELVPGAKEGFDQHGEGFAYYWATYFYDEVLKSLRHEVSGADDLSRDSASIERVALDSRRAQINVRSSLEKAGLPDTLIKTDETAAIVEKALG